MPNSKHVVIPAINCPEKDFDCVAEKVRVAESIGAEWIHIDFADGVFTYNKTWSDAAKWPEVKNESDLNLEVHLMAETPLADAKAWLEVGAKRLIVHAEIMHEEAVKELVDLAAQFGATVMVAMNPETQLEQVAAYYGVVNEYQVLGVHPGLARQKFLPVVLEKVKALRQALPDAVIEVDGGVNEEIGRQAVEAGANILISASCIFESHDPKAAYEMLCNL